MKSKRWKRRNRHKIVLLWLPKPFDDADIRMMYKPQPHRCLQEDYGKWRQSIYNRMN